MQSQSQNSRIQLSECPNCKKPYLDDGWGSALKPANEPICLARKPLEKGLTLAENVLKWGCGAINVDGSRIEAGADLKPVFSGAKGKKQADYGGGTVFGNSDKYESVVSPQGRWPANLILDETAAEMLDAQVKGKLYAAGNKKPANMNNGSGMFGSGKAFSKDINFKDFDGGASRFFYVAKASKRERNAGLEGVPKRIASTFDGNIDHEHGNRKIGARPDKPTELQSNHHPTVKPIKLMEYLCKLITPPNGTILDPFMGSGSTGVAAKKLGFNFIGIEMNEEYFEIAKRRINYDPRTS